MFQVLVFVDYLLLNYLLLIGQLGVDSLLLLLFVLYDEYLSALMVASGIRLSNLFVRQDFTGTPASPCVLPAARWGG